MNKTTKILVVMLLLLLLGLSYVAYDLLKRVESAQQQVVTIEQIQQVQADIQNIKEATAAVLSCIVNEDFNELKTLTQDKLRLELENADLKAQLISSGWLKESEVDPEHNFESQIYEENQYGFLKDRY